LTIQPSHFYTLAYCGPIHLISIEVQNIHNDPGSAPKNFCNLFFGNKWTLYSIANTTTKPHTENQTTPEQSTISEERSLPPKTSKPTRAKVGCCETDSVPETVTSTPTMDFRVEM
jgi:hypothetical protein